MTGRGTLSSVCAVIAVGVPVYVHDTCARRRVRFALVFGPVQHVSSTPIRLFPAPVASGVSSVRDRQVGPPSPRARVSDTRPIRPCRHRQDQCRHLLRSNGVHVYHRVTPPSSRLRGRDRPLAIVAEHASPPPSLGLSLVVMGRFTRTVLSSPGPRNPPPLLNITEKPGTIVCTPFARDCTAHCFVCYRKGIKNTKDSKRGYRGYGRTPAHGYCQKPQGYRLYWIVPHILCFFYGAQLSPLNPPQLKSMTVDISSVFFLY